jgi:Tfp pilus assembly protein PilX
MHMREEEGWVLVTALVLMLIMGVFATATLTLSNTETRVSASGRSRETAFNIAEAALNAQTFALTQHWPGQGGATNTAIRFPASCSQTSGDARCPGAASLTRLATGIDTVPGSSWSTIVRDNSGSVGASQFWNEAMVNTAPAYDANGDGQLWVRSQGIAAGKKRTMVALVHVEPETEPLPHATLIAGRLDISNMGRKTIIDTAGDSASTGQLAVRCVPTAGESASCLGHALSNGTGGMQSLQSLLDVQISPNVATYGYTGGASLTADAIERLRQTAIADGTYYTTCPASLTGSVVFIATTLTCSYTGNSVWNSPNAPGLVILTSGGLSVGGTTTFYGVIYHANLAGSTATNLVDLQGNTNVIGGIIIDGSAGLEAGSSKVNLQYSDAAYNAVKSNGTAGLVQNTWREIRGAS